ncbi:MAG: PP2C family protein-serine/threonine phosphatase [Candidatus Acidiferrales bacterium]
MRWRRADEAPCCDHVCGADKEEAREIQQSLIPTGGLKGESFEIAHRFTPLAEVGGDFADFFQLPNGRVGLYVGDVVGKGLSAAMYAALVMGMLRGINKTGADPAYVLELLNKRLLVRPVPGRYCATLYAVFDPAKSKLTFSNAGLPYPLLVSSGGITRLGDGGLPSGLFPGTTYEQHVVQLSPGDIVLFATDGLHELRNHWDEDFGWSELSELWKGCAQKSADESLEFLVNGARSFSIHTEQTDDITAVALKVPALVERNLSDPDSSSDGTRQEQSKVEDSFPPVPVTPW